MYFFVFFIASYAIQLYFYKAEDKTEIVLIEKVEKWPICDSIEGVDVKGDVITINFAENPLKSSLSNAVSSFSLVTSWYNQSVFFPTGSAEIYSFSELSLGMRFFLPVVGMYNATLLCSQPLPKIQRYQDISPYVGLKRELKLDVSDFSENHSYSRLRCHKEDSFLTRWCEGKNIPYFDGHFFFLSPAFFVFPDPFIVPGPRAAPFDKIGDRLTCEPIVIQFSKSSIPRNLTVHSKIGYLYGVFHNYYMLWHTLFDFVVPFYKFLHVANRTESREDRVIYVRSDGVWMFFPIMELISSEPVTIIDSSPYSFLFPNLVMGIEKFEKDISLSRTYDQSVSFTYNFDNDTAPGLRNDLLSILNIPSNEYGDNGKPLVVVIDRGLTKRNVVNVPEIVSFLKKECDFCEVKAIILEKLDVKEQISSVAKASVLLGLHGSGLSHVLWMAPHSKEKPTHLVEILPYNYSCRNWYNTAADVARVNYHSVMNSKPDPSSGNDMTKCWSDSKLCGSSSCHDRLRDQRTELEINSLSRIMNPIIQELKNANIS